MKKVVSLDEIHASEISSDSLYQEYTKYLQEDICKQFGSVKELISVPCPGCGNKENKNSFQKMGLTYQKCNSCSSLYVNPRPNAKALKDFYQNSKACQFWRKEITRFAESHWLHIHAPRMHWILDLVDEYLPEVKVVCDYQSKYPIFLNKLAEEKSFKSVLSLESILFDQSSESNKIRFDSANTSAYQNKINLLLAFEALERISDLDGFFEFVAKSTQAGALFLLTTATSSGFEYQVLGERAPNLNPINRMNLLSLETLTQKIQTAGFEILELSTPGRLDAQIVQKALNENPNLSADPFWKYIFKSRDEKTWHSLQDFLQLNRLSSHVRIAARKNG